MSFGTLLKFAVVPTGYTLFARQRVPGEITDSEVGAAASPKAPA